jgi:hypothetical protein
MPLSFLSIAVLLTHPFHVPCHCAIVSAGWWSLPICLPSLPSGRIWLSDLVSIKSLQFPIDHYSWIRKVTERDPVNTWVSHMALCCVWATWLSPCPNQHSWPVWRNALRYCPSGLRNPCQSGDILFPFYITLLWFLVISLSVDPGTSKHIKPCFQ